MIEYKAMEKTCTACKAEKPVENFYRRGKTGYRSQCKICNNNSAKKWQQENPEKVRAASKRFAKRHPERVKAACESWRARNKEYLKKWYLNYMATNPIQKQKYLAQLEEWRNQNPERVKVAKQKWAKENAGKVKEIHRNWRKKNPERHRAHGKNTRYKRRTQSKNSDITTDFLIELKKKVANTCPYCGLYTEMLHLDHIIPLSRGGTHTKDNVMYCCPTCNLTKHTKTLKEFNGMTLKNIKLTK